MPFLFNERHGLLGEGIYTNDQAAQLFWTDWLQEGFGPEPKAVQFGYPTGPQSLAATVAEATHAPRRRLQRPFGGNAVLAALAALAALDSLAPVRRAVAASLVGLPTWAPGSWRRAAARRKRWRCWCSPSRSPFSGSGTRAELARPGGATPAPGVLVALVLSTVASVFVYSLPGLVWFAIAVPIWLALELGTGRLRIDVAELRAEARRHRRAIVAVAVVVVAVGALSAAQLSGFVDKVGDVQESGGPARARRSSRARPSGSGRRATSRSSAARSAAPTWRWRWDCWRRRSAAWRRSAAATSGCVAVGAAAVLVYAGARLFASIYVEAKALAVIAPLVVVAALGALLAPRLPGVALSAARYALGVVVAVALAGSTLLALRAAPVGFDQRGDELESLAGLVRGRTVAFLGVDRFAGYWLRGTLMRSPGGYVPAEVKARPKKVWQQGLAMDLDTLAPRRLDDFDYAITTRAAYQSTAPPNFEAVVRTPSYVLWRRSGPTPPLQVIDKNGTPGRVLDCASAPGRRLAGRAGAATVIAEPVTGDPGAWSRGSPFDAPESATQTLDLGPGRWRLSLQYHSQAPLTVRAAGSKVELPPSLDGMYLTHQGQGAFWPAGALRVRAAAR